MSRRTKLLILGLFLVLLAIPVVYAVLTWSPAAPLRFRLVGERTEYRPLEDRTRRALEIEIENTTSVDIYTHGGDWLLREQNGAYEVEMTTLLDEIDPFVHESAEPLIIPAHTRLRREEWLRSREREDEFMLRDSLAGAAIRYRWMSGTKTRVRSALVWLHMHGPEFLRPHLPEIRKELNEAPLEGSP